MMWKNKKKQNDYEKNHTSFRISKKAHKFLTNLANKKGLRENRRVPLSEIIEKLAEREWNKLK